MATAIGARVADDEMAERGFGSIRRVADMSAVESDADGTAEVASEVDSSAPSSGWQDRKSRQAERHSKADRT